LGGFKRSSQHLMEEVAKMAGSGVQTEPCGTNCVRLADQGWHGAMSGGAFGR
jgi:hypothetical protein